MARMKSSTLSLVPNCETKEFPCPSQVSQGEVCRATRTLELGAIAWRSIDRSTLLQPKPLTRPRPKTGDSTRTLLRQPTPSTGSRDLVVLNVPSPGLVSTTMTPSPVLLLRPTPPSIDELLASLDLSTLPNKVQAHESIKRDFLTPPSHLSGPGWEDFALFVPFLCSQALQPTPLNPWNELANCISCTPPSS